jgi:hypothetical protein
MKTNYNRSPRQNVLVQYSSNDNRLIKVESDIIVAANINPVAANCDIIVAPIVPIVAANISPFLSFYKELRTPYKVVYYKPINFN